MPKDQQNSNVVLFSPYAFQLCLLSLTNGHRLIQVKETGCKKNKTKTPQLLTASYIVPVFYQKAPLFDFFFFP